MWKSPFFIGDTETIHRLKWFEKFSIQSNLSKFRGVLYQTSGNQGKGGHQSGWNQPTPKSVAIELLDTQVFGVRLGTVRPLEISWMEWTFLARVPTCESFKISVLLFWKSILMHRLAVGREYCSSRTEPPSQFQLQFPEFHGRLWLEEVSYGGICLTGSLPETNSLHLKMGWLLRLPFGMAHF